MPRPISDLELERLSALYSYGILDTDPEAVFDQIVGRLARTVDAPIAQITFVDRNRLWDKAATGLAGREAPRRGSLGVGIIEGPPLLVVPDLLLDPGTADNIAVTCAPYLQAYAGLRLQSPEGDAIGLIAVADHKPRPFDEAALAALEQAAGQVMVLLDSRRRSRQDDVTGALDRAAFGEQIRRFADLVETSGQSLSLIHLDLDPLRTELDSLKAGLGRIVLRRLADLSREQLRRRDSFGRIGENQFGVLLGDADESGARVLAQRLVEKLTQGWAGQGTDRRVPPVTVGIASARGGAEVADSLLARAEKAAGAPRRERRRHRVA